MLAMTTAAATEQSLGTFGRATPEQLAELDVPPIPFTLLGYQVAADKDGNHPEVEFTFHVKPEMEFGPVFAALSQANIDGSVPIHVGVQFLADAVIAEDNERLMKTLRDPRYKFYAETIGEMVEALSERYGLRPTAPRSVRRAGSRRSGASRTTAAKRSGRVTR